MEAKLDFLCMWIATIDPNLKVCVKDIETRSRILSISAPEKSSPNRKMTLQLAMRSKRKQLVISADVALSEEENLYKHFTHDEHFEHQVNGGYYTVDPDDCPLAAFFQEFEKNTILHVYVDLEEVTYQLNAIKQLIMSVCIDS
jgi:hypothetical protein